MPTDKDSTAVSFRTRAGQQPSNIAPAPQLDDVFPKVLLQTIHIDATASLTPPLVEALLSTGLTRWFDFIFSSDDDQFRQFTIGSGLDTITLYKNHVNQLLLLREMADKFVFDDDADHLHSAPYTHEAYMDFLSSVEPSSNNILPQVQHLLLLVSLPGAMPPFSTVAIKSEAKKDYDCWHRGLRTKDDFPILYSDEGYIIWLPKFRAELGHQGLTNFFDVDKDPSDLVPESFEWKLQQDQRHYLWTVLIFATDTTGIKIREVFSIEELHSGHVGETISPRLVLMRLLSINPVANLAAYRCFEGVSQLIAAAPESQSISLISEIGEL